MEFHSVWCKQYEVIDCQKKLVKPLKVGKEDRKEIRVLLKSLNRRK